MDGDAHTLYREFQNGRGMVDLSDRVKLALRGGDRVRYLNGQVTSNVSRLAEGVSQPACILSAKGKLAADVWIAATGDALLVDADATLRETLQGRLERYIIADDVTIDDLSDEEKLVHLLTPSLDGALPPAVRIFHSRRFGAAGYDLWIPAALFAGIWPVLA